MSDVERDLGIENLSRVEVERPSQNDLKIIKRKSDENISIIKLNQNSTDEEVKRNIVVNLIGALDYYVREIVLWGILVTTQDKFPKGKDYDKFMISIKFIKEVLEKNQIEEIIDKNELRKEIIELLKKPPHTYQKWQSIKDGLSIAFPKEIVDKISSLTTNPAKFQVNDIKKLNELRNNIVHHFDRDYQNESERKRFIRDVKNDIILIELVINSIHKIIFDYEENESSR